MATVYRCKRCNLSIPRQEELRRHLHWHQITDKDVDKYFTEEQQDDVPTPATVPDVNAGKRTGVGAKMYVVAAIAVIAIILAIAAIVMRGAS